MKNKKSKNPCHPSPTLNVPKITIFPKQICLLTCYTSRLNSHQLLKMGTNKSDWKYHKKLPTFPKS
jgi:hypothetical protein